MTPAQREAFTLHAQRVPVETIQAKTELTRPQIAAAVDLGRRHAQAALQPVAADPAPAAPQPPRVRRAAVRQLPGATIAPSPTLAVPADLEPAAREPAAAAPPAAAPVRSAPKQHLRKPAKQPGKPFDRDEKIRVLKALIEGVRKHLTEYEAELAELLATAPDPAPEPAPAAPAAPAEACAGPDPATSPEARAWALASGWAVPADGERLPGAIVLAYLRAHGGTQ